MSVPGGFSSSYASSHEASVFSVTILGGEFGGLLGGLVISHLEGQQLMLSQLYPLLVEKSILISVTD